MIDETFPARPAANHAMSRKPRMRILMLAAALVAAPVLFAATPRTAAVAEGHPDTRIGPKLPSASAMSRRGAN
jgi:hypothetical protein